MADATQLKRFDGNTCRYYIYPDTGLALNFTINHVGHHRISSHAYSWYGLKRQDAPMALIQYTVRGQGRLEFQGQTYDLLPGQAMLLTMPEDHHYFLPESSNYYEVLYLSLRGSGAIELLKKIREHFGVVVALRPDSPPIVALQQILEGPEISNYEQSAQAYNFLMLLSQELERFSHNQERPKFVDASLNFCRHHLKVPISVQELAQACHLSRAHFSREIKKYLGQSPGQLIRALRMKYALELLEHSPLSVKEIAGECGFTDVSYFIKVFYHYHHFTPGRRLQHRGKTD